MSSQAKHACAGTDSLAGAGPCAVTGERRPARRGCADGPGSADPVVHECPGGRSERVEAGLGGVLTCSVG